MMKITRDIKKQWSQLLLGDFTPHDIALGLAIGTLVTLLPTFGFSALLALLLIFIFPTINRPAIFISLIVWNPLVQIPVYAASFQLGSHLFADATLVKYDIEVLNQLYSFTRRFLIAHLIIVSSITLVTYFATWTILSLRQAKQTQKNTSNVHAADDSM
jgi:uncharacterized protein (DUF2062 family)